MNRKETTSFLSKLLKNRLLASRTYWASDLSLDYGTIHVKRVDYMEFRPAGVIFPSDIEKGYFVSYEVKSCKADFNSGFGKNFETEKGYFVMPIDLYAQVKMEIKHPIGVLVAIPDGREIYDEMIDPTPLGAENVRWSLRVAVPAYGKGRHRSTTELLFCMLRSGH